MSWTTSKQLSLTAYHALRGAGVAAAACVAMAGAANAGTGFVPTTAVSLPAGISSFDISYVDPGSHTYILGDRTNNGVDVIDTRTNTLRMIAGQGLFKGVVAVCAVANSCSGPNGVLIVNATTDSNGNVTGGEIWAGDAGSGTTSGPGCTSPNQCSSVKVLSLVDGHLIQNINTGGQFRADEMCFDPVDNVVMATNNADSPPFANVIDAGSVGAANKKIVAQIPWNQNTNGAEQCVYNPRTGLLYETAPELNGPGDNSQPGGVAVVDPKVAIAQNFSGTPGPKQGNDVPVIATWVIPLTACDGPQGMAVGPNQQMLVGCNGGPASTQSSDASVVLDDGSTGGTPGSVIAELQNQDGPDMVWYDTSTKQYLLARSTATPATTKGQLGIVSATTFVQDISIVSVATSGGAHSVASDSGSRFAYFPIPKASAASHLCSSVGGTDANGCILVLTRQISNTHDFDADTTSDLLWRDTSSNIALWRMRAANCGNTQVTNSGFPNVQSSLLGQVQSAWSVVGQRDFAGDGSSSILWRDTSGDLAIWQTAAVKNNGSVNVCGLTGGQVSNIASIGNVPVNWSVVGTGEFNANGRGDILWEDNQNNLAVWLMNGTTITGSRSIGKLPSGYVVVAADRHGWIFVQNPTTGDLAIWVVKCPDSSNTCTVTTTDFGSVSSNWHIQAIGDVNGDGFSDILWMDTSHDLAAWFLGTQNGAPIVVSGFTYGNVGAQWSLVQTGDVNGDGTADLIWLDTSGDIGAWFMQGTTVAGALTFGNVGTSWTVQSLNSQ